MVPEMMDAFTLNALKGWPQLHAVDFITTFSPDITDTVYPGSVLSLDSNGEFILGVGDDPVMPMFLFPKSTDPDVENEAPNAATTRGGYVPINPSGEAMALVGIMALELTSTNFDADAEDDYVPNAALTSPKAGANAGKLVVGTLYTNMIVGLVSRGIIDNGYGYDCVAFWPCPVFPTP